MSSVEWKKSIEEKQSRLAWLQNELKGLEKKVSVGDFVWGIKKDAWWAGKLESIRNEMEKDGLKTMYNVLFLGEKEAEEVEIVQGLTELEFDLDKWVGKKVNALYEGKFYPAVVDELFPEVESVVVVFDVYNNRQLCRYHEVRLFNENVYKVSESIVKSLIEEKKELQKEIEVLTKIEKKEKVKELTKIEKKEKVKEPEKVVSKKRRRDTTPPKKIPKTQNPKPKSLWDSFKSKRPSNPFKSKHKKTKFSR